MANIVQVEATNQLAASLALATYTATTTPIRVRLMTANGSATAAGTELASGGSYVAGTGQSLTAALGTASAGSVTTTSAVVFANMPASTIVGIELWDNNASPIRKWFGTITSEPGSGGDVMRSRSVARRDGTSWRLDGQKHFGSGSGISSFMITTALPEGETGPELFYFDARRNWDGSDGMKLIAEWDGHGMTATQSHAFSFENMAVVRSAWGGGLQSLLAASFGFVGCAFAAVIVGICDVAFETAREQLRGKEASMRMYDRVEWARAEMEHWLILQAYEGMIHSVESAPEGTTPLGVVQGKTAIAELAERAMARVCKVSGGGTFHRRSPLGNWFEDVRALGFLRPPWGLAYDRMIDASLGAEPG